MKSIVTGRVNPLKQSGGVDKIAAVLEKLDILPVDYIEYSLKTELTFNDEECLNLLAIKIYEAACKNNNELGTKYVQLAKKLFDLSYHTLNSGPVTFKDIFIKLSVDRFDEVFHPILKIHQSDEAKELLLIKFYAKLYNNDMVTSTLVQHWVKQLQEDTRYAGLLKVLLSDINDKVSVESRKPTVDKNVAVLRNQPLSKNIVMKPLSESKVETGALEKEATSEAKMWSDFDTAANRVEPPQVGIFRLNLDFMNQHQKFFKSMSPKQTEINPKTSFSEESCKDSGGSNDCYNEPNFNSYLELVSSHPKPVFDHKYFKRCSEYERLNLSSVMLQKVIEIPGNAKEYARIADRIRHECALSTAHHKTFGMFLMDHCSSEIDSEFSKRIKRWNRIEAVGIFLGELYNLDSIKNKLMLKWIDSILNELNTNVSAMESFMVVFFQIKKKLRFKSTPTHEKCLKALIKLSVQGKILIRKISVEEKILKEHTQCVNQAIGKPLARNQRPDVSKPEIQTAFVVPAAIPQCKESTAGSKTNQQLSCTEGFKSFLINIQADPKPEFNFQWFATNTLQEREACAKAMLGHAIANPATTEECANVALQIQHTCLLNSKVHKTFGVHLIEACLQEITSSFASQTKKWIRIRNVGMLISGLFNRHCIKSSLMTLWLFNILIEVNAKCEPAIKPFLTVFKLVMENLKAKIPANHAKCLDTLTMLLKENLIADDFKVWVNEVLGFTTGPTDPEALLITAPPKATGAIKKTIQDNSSQGIYENFQKFLNALETLKAVDSGQVFAFDCRPLESCTKATLKGCASILVEHSAEHSHNYKLYANATAEGIKGKLSLGKNQLFIKYLTEHLENEAVKGFNIENPERSNWKRILDVGMFLIELLSLGVIEETVVCFWIENLNQVIQQSNGTIEAALKLLEYFTLNLDAFRSSKFRAGDMNICQSKPESINLISSSNNVDRQDNELDAALLTDHNERFLKFCADLKSSSRRFPYIKNSIEKITVETPREMEKLACSYLEAAINSADVVLYARLAEIIENDLPRNEEIESFQKSLVILTLKQFDKYVPNAPPTADADINRVKSLAKLIAELFKMGWIDNYQLHNSLSALTDDDLISWNQLEIFHSVLQIVALQVVSNGGGNLFIGYRNLIESKLETFKQARSRLIALDILGTLNHIISLSVNSTLIKKEQVKSLVGNMKSEDFTEAAKKMNIRNEQQFNACIDDLLSKSTISFEEIGMIVNFVADMENKPSLNNGRKPKEVLVEKCFEMLSNNTNGSVEPSQLAQTIATLRLVAELYIKDFIDADFIFLALELLNDESDNVADCQCILMSKVGAKLEIDRPEKLKETFKKFEILSKQENEYRSSIYKQLAIQRLNEWVKAEEQQSDNSETSSLFGRLISGLTNDNIKITANTLYCSTYSEGDLNSFINALWNQILVQSNSSKLLAQLCKEMFAEANRSKEILTKFLLCRAVTFNSLKKDEYTIPVRQRLHNMIFFVAELYLIDMVDDGDIDGLLKPAKHLSYNSLSELIAKVTTKTSSSKSIHVKALMLNLDDHLQDSSFEVWQEVKDDIDEILKQLKIS